MTDETKTALRAARYIRAHLQEADPGWPDHLRARVHEDVLRDVLGMLGDLFLARWRGPDGAEYEAPVLEEVLEVGEVLSEGWVLDESLLPRRCYRRA